MPRYALISGGVVVNVIEHMSKPTEGEWIDCGPVSPGWTYDGTTFSPKAADPSLRTITRLAFARRFTLDEESGLEIASLDPTAGSPAARRQAARMRVAMRRVSMAKAIYLDDPEVRSTVQAYEAAGLLAPGRALEILDDPIEPHELDAS